MTARSSTGDAGDGLPTLAPDLDRVLERFGYAAFRPGQREAIETLLRERALLLVAPTGGGKSLAYQLPASFLGGTTLVVSPLIALMRDQVRALRAQGVRATYLASTLEAQESTRRLRALAEGAYDLVYVAPERLALDSFRRVLTGLRCPLVAVDEAHCISEWGHDFRPEYLQVGEVIAELDRPRVLACTATATPVVRDEILERLGLPPDTPQQLQGFARPNLALRAREIPGKRERAREVDAALAEALGAPGAAPGAGMALVYAPTRKGAEEEARRLAGLGWKAACYHAGLSGAERDAVHNAFAAGELELVVATNAFGMGIDRPDVRAVIHLGPPGSLEAYYQEVGRAGRDGERALGLLLFTGADFPLRRFLIESGAGGEPTAPEVRDHKWNLFLELMRWAEGGSCRHDAILRYFGDEAETLHGCGLCDVCTELADEERADPEEVTLIVRKALSGVARVNGRFGLGAAVQLLRGEPDERLQRAGLDRVSTFGALSDHRAEWLQQLLRRLVTAGWVQFSGERRPTVGLTEAGLRVMRGELPAQVLLPSTRVRRRAPAPGAPRGAAAGARVADAEALDAVGLQRFEALRAWRLETARREKVRPYVIASDRCLRDIALHRPRSHAELLQCHGIGPARAERYGDALLAVVTASAANVG